MTQSGNFRIHPHTPVTRRYSGRRNGRWRHQLYTQVYEKALSLILHHSQCRHGISETGQASMSRVFTQCNAEGSTVEIKNRLIRGETYFQSINFMYVYT
jgi:hypothetical protein